MSALNILMILTFQKKGYQNKFAGIDCSCNLVPFIKIHAIQKLVKCSNMHLRFDIEVQI